MTNRSEVEAFLEEIEPSVQSYVDAQPAADPRTIRSFLAFVQSVQIWNANWTSIRDEKLPEGQWTLLRLIFFSPEKKMAQSEIARTMGVTGTYVTKLIDALEEMSYLQRVVNREDRRVTYAVLTSEGLEFCQRVIPQIIDSMKEELFAFSTEDKRRLHDLMIKLCVGMSTPPPEGWSPNPAH
jgi:DNA-binding MarR family transcriptional regulator